MTILLESPSPSTAEMSVVAHASYTGRSYRSSARRARVSYEEHTRMHAESQARLRRERDAARLLLRSFSPGYT